VRQQRADIDSLYELTEQVDRKVDAGFAAVDARLGGLESSVDARFGQLEAKVDGLDAKLDQILERLTSE
jgi:hypothetical protein